MTDDRRRFPWANAHRIADDHDREVSQLDTAAFGDIAKDFPEGIFYNGMTNPPQPGPKFVVIEGPLSPGQADRFREMLVDGFTPDEARSIIDGRAFVVKTEGNVVRVEGKLDLEFFPPLAPGEERDFVICLPPLPPRAWRWWRDPIVIGAAIGFVAVFGLFLWAVTP